MGLVTKHIEADILNRFKQTYDEQEQDTEQDGERNGNYFFHQVYGLVRIGLRSNQ